MTLDPLEQECRSRSIEINSNPSDRPALEAQHGQVWTTSELTEDFEVLGFLAPFVVVRRRADGVLGSVEFQHNPRFFFNFEPDE